MTDTPTSLTSKLWGFAMSILGVAVALAVAVDIIQNTWVWLVVITAIVLGIIVVVRGLWRWWERGRW